MGFGVSRAWPLAIEKKGIATKSDTRATQRPTYRDAFIPGSGLRVTTPQELAPTETKIRQAETKRRWQSHVQYGGTHEREKTKKKKTQKEKKERTLYIDVARRVPVGFSSLCACLPVPVLCCFYAPLKKAYNSVVRCIAMLLSCAEPPYFCIYGVDPKIFCCCWCPYYNQVIFSAPL